MCVMWLLCFTNNYYSVFEKSCLYLQQIPLPTVLGCSISILTIFILIFTKYQFKTMKKALFLSLFLCPFFLHAQVIFESFTSFDALLEKAQKDKKFIFIQIESNKCAQCNDVAMAGLSNKQLKEKYAVNFISTKLKEGDDLFSFVLNKYSLKEFMGSLYLDNKGNLLLKNNATTSFASTYLDWADKAMANVDNLAVIADLERTYQSGDRTTAFLEKYIRALRDADMDSDAIMEEYIGKTIVDSVKTDRIILFVKEQGLSLSSSAYKAVHSLNSSKKIDSIWYLMPLAKRIKINNRTTSQTYQEAVKNKDKMLIYQLSSFTQNIHGSNYRQGEFISQAQRVGFHSAIKDTSGFIQRADMFASNIMRVSNDSLKAWNTKEREEIFSNREPEKRFRPVSSTYADQLNTMAWQCYLLINEARYLEKALKWSERSIAIYNDIPISTPSENAAYLDTYAHLLYKLKRYDEAVEWQTKAVEAQKTAQVKSNGFEQELEKMKSRKL